jgi:hypothetical protein
MNRQIRRKYNSVMSAFKELDKFVELGLIEKVVDPETGEDGWRIKPEGLKLLENYQEVNKNSIS